jgi:hypothetical protein
MMTQHVDGDDYTWENGDTSKAPPVLNTPAESGTADAWADRWQRQAERLGLMEISPDLRTLAEREQDDVAALRADLERIEATVRLKIGPVDVALQVDEHGDQIVELGLRCDNLVDALAALTVRLVTLERSVARLAEVLEVRL